MTIKSTLMAIACLGVLSFAAIPEIRVTTQNNTSPTSQTDNGCGGGNGLGGWGMGGGSFFPYVKATEIKITDPNDSRNNITRTSKPDSIRIRGNSTAGVDKKPYRIKFGENVSIFGKEAAKSWVLLANWYDATFALNAIAFEMGKRMNLEFTNSSQLVDLYINNTYMGIYQLTEQVQSHKGRVDLKEKHNGWLVEFDYHSPASDECLSYYTTGSNRYNLTTFIKSPQLDDTSFTKNPRDSSQLRFVKNDIKALVDKMAESGFPNNGYRDLIDLESFAKYVLIQLFMDNFDFNSKAQTGDGGLPGSNYAYKVESCGKIKAGPLWDFDLAAGVINDNTFAAHYKTTQGPIIPPNVFYKRLWEDPVFKAKYKKLWDKHKSDFQAMSSFVDNIKTQVEGSVTGKGKNLWASNIPVMGGGCFFNCQPPDNTLTTQQFNTEVSGLKNWLTQRISWVDGQLSNINTSADIVESTPVCNTSSSSSRPNTVSSSSANNIPVSSSSANNSGSVTLTCTGLQANVEKGGTIAEPTLTCSNGSNPTDQNWFGRPSGNTSWTTNAASTTTSYTISVSARCGSVQAPQVTCGTVAVGDVVPIKLVQIASSNAISIMHNSINLQVQSTAKLYLYNLNGKLQKSMFFGSGVYNVPLGDLPKGMYVMQARLGNEKKVQRFVVK